MYIPCLLLRLCFIICIYIYIYTDFFFRGGEGGIYCAHLPCCSVCVFNIGSIVSLMALNKKLDKMYVGCASSKKMVGIRALNGIVQSVPVDYFMVYPFTGKLYNLNGKEKCTSSDEVGRQYVRFTAADAPYKFSVPVARVVQNAVFPLRYPSTTTDHFHPEHYAGETDPKKMADPKNNSVLRCRDCIKAVNIWLSGKNAEHSGAGCRLSQRKQ